MVLNPDPNLRLIELIKPRNVYKLHQWKIFFARTSTRFLDPFRISNSIQRFKPINKRIYKYLDPHSNKTLIAPTFPQRESMREILAYTNDRFIAINKTLKKLQSKYIIDIGANIGISSRSYALCGSDIEVISIEPDLRNLSFAATNLNDLSNVSLYQMGLSNKFGRFNLSIPSHNNSRKGEKKAITGNLSALGGENQKGTRFFNGDDFLIFSNIPPDQIGWIKIDVEGFELNVIQGFTNSLKKTKAIFEIEINAKLMNLSNSKFSDFLDLMKKYSYMPFVNDVVINKGIENSEQFDVLFVKDEVIKKIPKSLNISELDESLISLWENKYLDIL